MPVRIITRADRARNVSHDRNLLRMADVAQGNGDGTLERSVSDCSETRLVPSHVCEIWQCRK
jgi:hypothetical protein